MTESADNKSAHYALTDWPRQAIEYDEEIPIPGQARGWIQWKGTDVCMDIHCPCGHHSHMDTDFLYFFKCKCGVNYAVGQTVRLYPVHPDYVEKIVKDSAKTESPTEYIETTPAEPGGKGRS